MCEERESCHDRTERPRSEKDNLCVGQTIVQGDEGPVIGVAQKIQIHAVAGVRHEEE